MDQLCASLKMPFGPWQFSHWMLVIRAVFGQSARTWS